MLRPIVALAGALALAASAAFAQTPTPRVEEQQTVLRLVETAQRAMRRDRLRAELRAEVAGADARKVQVEINQKMTAALERAKAVKSVQVETGGYSVWQERPQNAPVRWRGVQGLALIGAEFADVLSLAGELQQAGLVFSGMMFDLRPETARSAEDELTAEALERLRMRAERIAAELGLDVTRYRELRVGNALGDRPRPPALRMEMAAQAAPPPAAEAGEQMVQVTVEAEILLGAARGP